MHSEKDIKEAIRPLVEYYGVLNTTQIKNKIEEVITFDDEDLLPSETRPRESKIMQIIGNVVSHQRKRIKVYPQGFIVDKNTKIACFFAIEGLSKNEVKISKEEIERRQERAKANEGKRRIYRKINWDLENERRTQLGTAGEVFVYKKEIEFVEGFDPKSINRVIHLSAKQGDGFGYDIASINEKGESVYIEVKTTKGPEEAPFFMSITEKSFFEDNVNNNAFVYRVYDFDENDGNGKIKKISAAELLENYEFDPISFKVTKKQT